MSMFDRTCLRLASKGWCGGNPETIAKMPVTWVFKMLGYQIYQYEYQSELQKLSLNT